MREEAVLGHVTCAEPRAGLLAERRKAYQGYPSPDYPTPIPNSRKRYQLLTTLLIQLLYNQSNIDCNDSAGLRL